MNDFKFVDVPTLALGIATKMAIFSVLYDFTSVYL